MTILAQTNKTSINLDNILHLYPSSTTQKPPFLSLSTQNHNDIGLINDALIPSLGTLTSSNSNFSKKENDAFAKRQSVRAANFKLTNTTKRLMKGTEHDRVCVCMSHRLSKDDGILIKHNKKAGNDGRAYFTNIIQCNAPHICITCNNRIMSKRSREVEQGYDYFVNELHGFVPMLTLTIPHYKGGDLVLQMKLINTAYKRLMGDAIMRKIWALLGKVGAIRGTEYTYGNNGHHNHIHSLIFIKKSHHDVMLPITRWTTPKRKGMLKLLTPDQEKQYIDKGLQHTITYQSVEDFIKFYWFKLCRDIGLGSPSLKRGAVFSEGDNVKSYIAKHKSAQEITNSRDKKAKKGNRNQWQLLIDYQDGDIQAGEIFKEYASAFSGGNILRWSNGLKKMLLIDDVEDDGIKDVDEEVEHEVLEEITPDVWQIIKRYSAQACILSAVENDYRFGSNEYKDLIDSTIAKNLRREKKLAQKREQQEQICLGFFNIPLEHPPKWFLDHHQNT